VKINFASLLLGIEVCFITLQLVKISLPTTVVGGHSSRRRSQLITTAPSQHDGGDEAELQLHGRSTSTTTLRIQQHTSGLDRTCVGIGIGRRTATASSSSSRCPMSTPWHTPTTPPPPGSNKLSMFLDLDRLHGSRRIKPKPSRTFSVRFLTYDLWAIDVSSRDGWPDGMAVFIA